MYDNNLSANQSKEGNEDTAATFDDEETNLLESLFDILQDRTTFLDEDLPKTGVDIHWERHSLLLFANVICKNVFLMLVVIARTMSSIFVESSQLNYGTRSSTVKQLHAWSIFC